MIIAKPIMVQWINSEENSWNWYRNPPAVDTDFKANTINFWHSKTYWTLQSKCSGINSMVCFFHIFPFSRLNFTYYLLAIKYILSEILPYTLYYFSTPWFNLLLSYQDLDGKFVNETVHFGLLGARRHQNYLSFLRHILWRGIIEY